MSQSKQKRLEQKRATILATAERVLIKHGKNATMGDIATALDMDKSSLYYYYKGIPEILNAILDQEYYDFSVHISQIRKENKSHIDVLKELRDRGNTVVIVEHDLDIIREADFLIDLGPGAGRYGGDVLYQGGLGEASHPESKTIKSLASGLPVTNSKAKKPVFESSLSVKGA